MRSLVKRLGAADLLEKPLDCARFCSILYYLTVEGKPLTENTSEIESLALDTSAALTKGKA